MLLREITPARPKHRMVALVLALMALSALHHVSSMAADSEAKKESKSLEDSPEALEKIRQILQKGIPERMTVQVKNSAKDSSKDSTDKGGVIRVAAPADNKAEQKADAKATPKAEPKTAPKVDAKAESKAESKTEAKSETKAENPATDKQESKPEAPSKPKPVARKPASKPAEASSKPIIPWSYSGAGGPENWGNLEAANLTCSKGKNQSPIHIETGEAIPLNLEPLQLSYGELYGTIVNTGNTVQVDTSGSNTLKVRGRSYGLSHIQFKHPAEEVINHQGYPMSMQWIHKDFQGNMAIVSVLVEVGAANPAINSLWSRMPLLVKERNPVLGSGLNLSDLLPASAGYYAYTGSWTVPPCTEGVLWIVLKTPITLSAAQIATFAKLYPMNARPVQPTNGRLIQVSQ